MKLDDARLVPLLAVGTGRIARFDGAICLVGDDPSRVATAALFDACRNHLGDGASLIQKVAGILTRAAGASLPPFAIVAQDGDALLLAVHGSVTILAEQPGGPLRLGGGDTGTWATSRVLDAAYLSAVTADGAMGAVPALVDLQRGVAVADSFVMLAVGVSPGDLSAGDPAVHDGARLAAEDGAGERPPQAPPVEPFVVPTPEAAPPPPTPTPAAAPLAPAPQPPLGFKSLADGAFKIVQLRPATGVTPDAPLPIASQAAPATPPSGDGTPSAGVRVQGVHCGRGHFNDPRARYCAVCGLAMFQNSMVLAEGVRPPLGVLLLSNGESYPLQRGFVIGREPGNHPDVLHGVADALIPAIQGPSISRVHARVLLEGWDVLLVDEGSTNGTFVWDESSRQWIRLSAQQPYVLRPGDQLAFGELTASFETSLQH